MDWSDAAKIDRRAIAVAALGMSAPAVLGLAIGRPAMGFTIGLGAMLLAGETPISSLASSDQPSPQSTIIPAALAVTSATVIAGAPWTDAAMILFSGIAAMMSGYSRPVGTGAVRFIVYLVLSVTLLDNAGAHRGGAALVFGLGALWNFAVRVMLAGPRAPRAPAPPTRTPTSTQLRTRWRRTMTEITGWQFPIRLVVGLAVASVLRHLWPSHHYAWMVLTVALLTQRPVEHFPVKTTQRAFGAGLGVTLTCTILVTAPSPFILGVAICGLATAAALARARNYLAYTAISTPVILLVMDFGKTVEPALLMDRLVATVTAAAIVVALNLGLDGWMRAKMRWALKRKAAPNG